MAGLEMIELASKVTQPVRAYSEVVGEPNEVSGSKQVRCQLLSYFVCGGLQMKGGERPRTTKNNAEVRRKLPPAREQMSEDEGRKLEVGGWKLDGLTFNHKLIYRFYSR